MAIRDGSRFEGQTHVFSIFVKMDVALNQFIPNLFFRDLHPFALYFDDATSCATDPRDVFRNIDEFNPLSYARFAHSLAVEWRIRPTN
jgi:hypothetical protein